RFFSHHFHRAVYIYEYRRLEKITSEIIAAPASGQHSRTFRDGISDVIADHVQLVLICERTHVGRAARRRANSQLPDFVDDRGDELLSDRLGDVEPFDRSADLAAVHERAP